MQSLVFGISLTPDAALFLVRLVIGLFFFLARFRWLYDPSRPEACWFNAGRRDHLNKRICTCGYPFAEYIGPVVAVAEIASGIALILGLGTVFAAGVLFVTLCFATVCTAKPKVMEQNPVDTVDCVSCYLWRVEGIYLTLCLALILSGPGMVSLDYVLFG